MNKNTTLELNDTAFRCPNKTFFCTTGLNALLYAFFSNRVELPGYAYELLLVCLNLYYEYNSLNSLMY